MFIGDDLISWSSTKVLAHSSIVSEYYASASVSNEIKWIKSLVIKIGMQLKQKLLIYCDNINAKYLAQNPMMHQRTKYIEINIHFIREKVLKKELVVLIVL